MTTRRRIQAIRAVVAGSIIATSQSYADIDREFAEIVRVGMVLQRDRRHLLQILHSTRALDSSLREFTDLHGIRTRRRSLGGYLHALANHRNGGLARLPGLRKSYYQAVIVNVRNRYMHEAGAFPTNNREIQYLLSEMYDCLLTVLAL